jgi:hypothetical protein
MQHGDIIQFDNGVAKVSQLRDLQNCDAWKRALQNKCKDYRYYEIVEETLECGFEHHYLLLEDASGNVRAIQPCSLSGKILSKACRAKSAPLSMESVRSSRAFSPCAF